jgi:peptidoglycan/LPS O-acetylase OafA/YrhL
MKYRPDIDGLRAIAVVAVVLFHAFPEYVPGGFIGVDVFFVISGYLISGIIFDEVQLGSFTLSSFYARRVRRIFPALIVVISITVVASWFILLPSAFVRFGKQVIASSIFGSNFFFWLQSGYFSPDANSFPLLHLWSLGVEEQFYIVWPLLALLLAAPRRWKAAILLIGVASLMLSVLLAEHRELDFYLPITRAWELMAGAALASLERGVPAAKKIRAPELVTLSGLGLIAASVILLDHKVAYPSWRAAFPVAGAMLVVIGGQQSWLARHMLANRAAVFTGLISYPLYLWHWPILVLAAAVKFMPLTPLERGLAIAISYGLATITFILVERPLRSGRPTRRQVVSLASCAAAIAVTGIIIVRADGFENRFPSEVRLTTPDHPEAWRSNECLLDLTSQSNFAEGCAEQARPLVVVWGDSTAAALMPGLRRLQAKEGFGITQLTANSCQPLLGRGVSTVCQMNNQRVRKLIEASRPNVIVLHGFGPLDDATKEGWSNTLAALKGIVPRVVIIGPVPLWKRGLPEQSLSYYITHRSYLPQRSNTLVYNLWNDEIARNFFESHGANYVSAWSRFCNTDGCLTKIDDRTLSAVDEVHLSERGSVFLVSAIAGEIFGPQTSNAQP